MPGVAKLQRCIMHEIDHVPPVPTRQVAPAGNGRSAGATVSLAHWQSSIDRLTVSAVCGYPRLSPELNFPF